MATSPGTMKAIVQDRYGTTEQMRPGELAPPAPGRGEVLVRVKAAGLDRGVWHLMTGKPYLLRLTPFGGLRGPKKPTPGSDLAGTVVAVGEDVSRFSVGDEVMGIGSGSFAEYATAPEAKLVHKPEGVGFPEAGTAAISGITALQALTKIGRLEPGQDVLVIGAAGGVGSFAAQIAVALGATVTGVASSRKVGFVKDLGVHDVIDYQTEDYLDGSRQFDLIIDTGGSNPVRHLRRALRPKGTLVIVGGEGGGSVTGIGRQIGGALLSPFVGHRITFFISQESREDIQRVADLLADGSVRSAVGAEYSLAEAPRAVHDLEQGAFPGKAAIVVEGEEA